MSKLKWIASIRARRSEAGTTLIELMVAIGVMAVLGLATTGLVSNFARSGSISSARVHETADAQTVIDRLTRYLRAAEPCSPAATAAFTVATSTHITLCADLGDVWTTGTAPTLVYTPMPRLVDVNVSGATTLATLTENVTKADGASTYTYTGTPAPLTDGRLVDATKGIFTFYDASGNLLTAPVSLSAIGAVKMTLVEQDAGLSTPVTVTSYVYLRSVEY